MRITEKILRETIESLANEPGIDFCWGHSNGYARIEKGNGGVLVMDGTNKECLDWIKGFRTGWYMRGGKIAQGIKYELVKG